MFHKECPMPHRRGYTTRWWHRLWCRECREAQEIDALVGFGLMQMQDTSLSTHGMLDTLAALDLVGGGKAVRRAARHIGVCRLLRAGRVLAVGLVALAGWWQYMNYIPPLHIPPKHVPTPNAFTYFKEAGTQLNYAAEVGAAVSLPLKEAKPTPRIDRFETTSTAGYPIRIRRIFDNDHLYTLADKQLLLDLNRDTLVTLRQGMAYEYVETYQRSWTTIFPYFAQYHAIARLLLLEAQMKENKGDWNGAMQSRLDAMEMGAKIPHGARIIGELVGTTCQAIGRKGMWNNLARLTAPQTRAAIARLEVIQAQYQPYAVTLREEEWYTLEAIRSEMKKPGWRFNLISFFNENLNPDWYSLIFLGCSNRIHRHTDWRSLMFLGWSNRVLLNDIWVYMDESVARSQRLYQQERALTPQVPPNDPLADILFPVFSKARFNNVSNVETQSALLLTTLALHAYALEHAGQYPSTLQALTPMYLHQVPVDPFAWNNAPLRYRNLGTIDNYYGKFAPAHPMYPGKGYYKLYSVGPDGKDDGGLAIDLMLQNTYGSGSPKPTPTDANRYYVHSESTGDIVAGLNTI